MNETKKNDFSLVVAKTITSLLPFDHFCSSATKGPNKSRRTASMAMDFHGYSPATVCSCGRTLRLCPMRTPKINKVIPRTLCACVCARQHCLPLGSIRLARRASICARQPSASTEIQHKSEQTHFFPFACHESHRWCAGRVCTLPSAARDRARAGHYGNERRRLLQFGINFQFPSTAAALLVPLPSGTHRSGPINIRRVFA